MHVGSYIILFWAAAQGYVLAAPEPTRRLFTLSALDCRRPKRTRYGLRAHVCNITEDGVTELPPRDMLILLRSPKQEIKGYTCEKHISKFDSTCGLHSHQKLVEPPSIMEPLNIKDDECKEIVRRGLYRTEDGQVLNIQPDTSVMYKYVPVGFLTNDDDNSYCQGGVARVQGRVHTSILRMVTVRLTVTTVSLEHDIFAGNLVDVTNHVPLKAACVTDNVCTIGTKTYYLPVVGNRCPYYPVRTLPLSTAYVPIAGSRKTDQVLVSHEHKVILEVIDSMAVPPACANLGIRGTMVSTNIDSIFVTADPTTIEGFVNLAKVLPPSSINVEIELKTVGEYLAYYFEGQLRRKLRTLHSSLCRLNEEQVLSQDVSPFHKNALIRARGDIVQELLCTKVDVTLELGSTYQNTCYEDAIHGRIGSEFVLVRGYTRLVTDPSDGVPVHCDSVMPPIFVSKEGEKLVAQPEVAFISVELEDIDLDVRHALEIEGQILHEEFRSDLFYTESEMDSFNDLLHWQRVKTQVVSSLVRRYCANADCGAYVGPSEDVSPFDPTALLEKANPLSWFVQIKENVVLFGNICSIIVVVYLLISIFRFCIGLGRLIFSDRLPVPEAIRYSVGLSTIIRRRMLDERQDLEAVRFAPPEPRLIAPVSVETPAASAAEPLTERAYVPAVSPVNNPCTSPPSYSGLANVNLARL